jgi:DNA-directed RNA polymerase subunit beta'
LKPTTSLAKAWYSAPTGEVQAALDAKIITLHTKIKGRYKTVDEAGNMISEIHDTTAGRYLLADLLPKNAKVPFDVANRLMTKKEISRMIDTVYRACGQKETVIFADQVMGFGFRQACKAGISFGKDDMVIPDTKKGLVDETRTMVEEFEQQYNDGLITQGEKYNKVVDAWAKCTDKVADEMMGRISAVEIDEETGVRSRSTRFT